MTPSFAVYGHEITVLIFHIRMGCTVLKPFPYFADQLGGKHGRQARDNHNVHRAAGA